MRTTWLPRCRPGGLPDGVPVSGGALILPSLAKTDREKRFEKQYLDTVTFRVNYRRSERRFMQLQY